MVMANTLFPVGPTLVGDDAHDTIPVPATESIHDAPTLPSLPAATEATGPRMKECPRCEGVGHITADAPSYFDPGYGQGATYTCDECSGAGEVEDDNLEELLAASILKVRAERGSR